MQERKLTIYFTSDLHSYIYPTDYRSQKEQDLGLFKCASQFQKDGNTLIIDGGDLLQGSPFGAFCHDTVCLLYTSPSPRDRTRSRMPSSA